MFLVNSRYRHFSAAPSCSVSLSLHTKGHTFSLSYGVILPSSLTRVLSSALGFSPHLPVSVFGTITRCISLRGFSWQHGINQFVPLTQILIASRLLFKNKGFSSRLLPTCLNHLFHQTADLPSCFPPSLKRYSRWYRNINLFPITYASRPRLRVRLTLGRLALPRNP